MSAAICSPSRPARAVAIRSDAGGEFARLAQYGRLRIVAILQALAAACVGFAGDDELLEALGSTECVEMLQQIEQGRVAQLSHLVREQVVAPHQHAEFAIRIRYAQARAQ